MGLLDGVLVGYDTLSYPLLCSWKLVCLSLVASAASYRLFRNYLTLLLHLFFVPMCWLVYTDPVGAAGSAEFESKDLQGGYFAEFDDAPDE